MLYVRWTLHVDATVSGTWFGLLVKKIIFPIGYNWTVSYSAFIVASAMVTERNSGLKWYLLACIIVSVQRTRPSFKAEPKMDPSMWNWGRKREDTPLCALWMSYKITASCCAHGTGNLGVVLLTLSSLKDQRRPRSRGWITDGIRLPSAVGNDGVREEAVGNERSRCTADDGLGGG